MAAYQSNMAVPGAGWVTAFIPVTGSYTADKRALVVSGWVTLPVPGDDPCVFMYKMRGMDAAIDSLYDTWLAYGAPDMSASKYTGALTRPLRDVIVIDAWPGVT